MREWYRRLDARYARWFRQATADGHTLEEILAIAGVTLLVLSALIAWAGYGG